MKNKKNITEIYVQESTKGKSFVTEGKITEIAFSAQKLEGKINNQEVFFSNKDKGQHIIKFGGDNIVVDLSISSHAIDAVFGYVIVYKEIEVDENESFGIVSDDLEGI